MNNKCVRRLLLVLIAMACCVFQNPAIASSEDEAAVSEAVSEFYTALNSLFMGDVDQMNMIWSHADDVTYMGPGGGLLVGWDQLSKYWQARAVEKLGGKITPDRIHFLVGQEIAVTSNFEIGENTNTTEGPQQVSIRVTNVLRKENGEWKMVSHHTDLLSFLEK